MFDNFSWQDYAVFGCSLVIPLVIGVVFAIKAGKSQSTYDYLLASGHVHTFPTALSLFSSFVCSVTVLAYPSHILTFGLTIIWTMPAAAVALIITLLVILPVVFHTTAINAYQYFGLRFDSRILKFYGSSMFVFGSIFYLSNSLAVPAEMMAEVNSVPGYVFIIITGTICTVYTTIGGLRTVVWADAFQAVLLYAALILMVVKGLEMFGGFENVWEVMKLTEKVDSLTHIEFDPRNRETLLATFFGGIFYWMSAFGSNQVAIQRYSSLPTYNRAVAVIVLNIFFLAAIMILLFLFGLILVAYFSQCGATSAELSDPIKPKMLVMIFIDEVFNHKNGLHGLVIAGLFSGSLSTLSSGINSLAAVTWDNFLLPFNRSISEVNAAWSTKLLVASYGILITLMSCIFHYSNGQITMIHLAFDALWGTLTGIFLLGSLVPRANWIGALTGSVLGSWIVMWLFIGQRVSYPQNDLHCIQVAFNSSMCTSNATFDGTFSLNNFNNTWNETSPCLTPQPVGDLQKFHNISPALYPLISCLMVLLCGIPMSLCAKNQQIMKRKPDLVLWSAMNCVKHADGDFSVSDQWSFFDSGMRGGMGQIRAKRLSSKRSTVERDSEGTEFRIYT